MLLLDTNILIRYLAGDDTIVAFIDAARQRGDRLGISVITEIELLASPALEQEDEVLIDRLLAALVIVDLRSSIGRAAAQLRRDAKLTLGDAVIAATAQSQYATLVTRDVQLAKRSSECGIATERI